MPPDDSKLISDFEYRTTRPDDIKCVVDQFDKWRRFVHTDAMRSDDPRVVATNFVYRNQQVMLDQLFARGPRASAKPAPRLQPKVASIAGVGDDPSEVIDTFCRTTETLLNAFGQMANLQQIAYGTAQDASTTGIGIVKLSWQSSYTMGALGTRVLDEAEEREAEIERLTNKIADENLPPDSAEAIKLQQAIDARTLSGVKHVGFVLDPIEPEDFGWDWDIRRPEQITDSKWMWQRLWYRGDEIVRRFGIAPADFKDYGISRDDNQGDVNRSRKDDDDRRRRDVDDHHIGETIGVIEMWDKLTGHVYTYIPGAARFLRVERPTVRTARFFPFYPLIYNRVTGRMLGISDVELQHKLQIEVNHKRTNDNLYREAALPRWVVGKGLLTKKILEKMNANGGLPALTITELEKVAEIRDSMVEFAATRYDPRLTDFSAARSDMEAMAGAASSSLGDTGGAELATSEVIANEHFKARLGARQHALKSWLVSIYRGMFEIARKIVPLPIVQAIVGPGAVWPSPDESQLFEWVLVDIDAGLDGDPNARKELELLTMIAQLFPALGIVPAPGFAFDGSQIAQRVLSAAGMHGAMHQILKPLDPMAVIARQLTDAAQGAPPAQTPSPMPVSDVPSVGSLPNSPMARLDSAQ